MSLKAWIPNDGDRYGIYHDSMANIYPYIVIDYENDDKPIASFETLEDAKLFASIGNIAKALIVRTLNSVK